MHVKTNFNKGLITEVIVQYGVWGELNFTKRGFKLGAGIHPVLLDGNVEAIIPTSVNIDGNLNYTNHKFSLPTIVRGYLKTNYDINLNQNNTKLKFSSSIRQAGFLHFKIEMSLWVVIFFTDVVFAVKIKKNVQDTSLDSFIDLKN